MEELFKIEAGDSPETREVKDKFNLVHNDLAKRGDKKGADLHEEFKGKILEVVKQNTDLEEKMTAVIDELKNTTKDHETALLELNRFRTTATANEAKGISFGEALNKAIDENEGAIKDFGAKQKGVKSVQLELKAVGDMGLSSITGLTAANVQVAPGIVPFPSRSVHMRQLLPTGRMSTSLYNFLREVGFDGSIGTWQENSGAKPQFDIRYIESSAPSQFIAGYLKISRKSLDDIPALKASIAARLLQKYLDAEDNQILNGTGANGQLLGLYNAANSLVYGPGGAGSGYRTKSVEMVVDSMSLLEELNHNVTAVLVRPQGWHDLLLSQSSGSTSGIYSLPGYGMVNLSNGQLSIAGANIFKSTAQNPNTFLTGDWDMGAQLLLREDPIVEFFEQDGDNVKNNQITVRVEGRVALPVYYNDAFIHGTFINPGS
jgi:HK97 family phage major capsid protein